MDVSGKSIIVTGGGSGIGAALVRKLVQAGAKLVIADINIDAAQALAEELGATACRCDVTVEADIQALVAFAEEVNGPVDIFVSNAGLGRGEPDHAASAPNDVWQLNWDVHVMSHVFAARAVLPAMIARGDGYLVQMASAAGLLCQIGDAAYSATKHAAVSFAESLAISHGMDGVKVSVICPQYVATPLLGLTDADAADRETLLTPDDAAEAIMAGIVKEEFLILTHPDVKTYMGLKSGNYDRWLEGMRLLRAKALNDVGRLEPQNFYKLS